MSSIHKSKENMMLLKWGSLIFLLLIISSIILAGAPEQGDNQIAWIENQVKIDAAKLDGKPGMLYFYGGIRITSPTGKKGDTESVEVKESPRVGLSNVTLNNENIVALSRKFSCFEFNFVYSPKISAQYAVTTYPVVIFTDHWGNEVNRFIGNVPAEKLISYMEIFPEDYSDVLNWTEILKKDRKNFEALKGMGEFYLNLEAWEMSNKYFNQASKTHFAKEHNEALEDIILLTGLNELRMRNYKEAQKLFQSCLIKIPEGKKKDMSLLGLILAQLGQDNLLGAERSFQTLKSQFPDSPAVEQAQRYVQSVKKLK